MNQYADRVRQGCVVVAGSGVDSAPAKVEDKPWNPHPAFAGVALKHLLTGVETGGTMSLHLVRIDPGCCIGSHVHEKNWELHQVVSGQGECLACGQAMPYEAGVQASLPSGEAHEVRAGSEGLVMLATFSPPLV